MIKKEKFKEVNDHIKSAVIEVFDHVKKTCSDDKYMLFLANGEYQDQMDSSFCGFNPHTIDDILDDYRDETRIKFLTKFLNSHYIFPEGILQIEDNEYRLNLELMIYTHIWESKSYLKQLFRIAELSNDKNYPWKIEVPVTRKHSFIQNEISNKLLIANLSLGEIISNGFHSSLRNAFAHSDYSIEFDSLKIILHSFNSKKKWDIPSITFEEWTLKFINSSLLSYHFLRQKIKRRRSIVSDLGKCEFIIAHPISRNSTKFRKIIYIEDLDIFRFLY